MDRMVEPSDGAMPDHHTTVALNANAAVVATGRRVPVDDVPVEVERDVVGADHHAVRGTGPKIAVQGHAGGNRRPAGWLVAPAASGRRNPRRSGVAADERDAG